MDSSHGVAAAQAISASPAGTTESPPSAKVATTSQIGSGQARSKRRTNASQANDSANGRRAHAAASPRLGGRRVALDRCIGGRTGDARRARK